MVGSWATMERLLRNSRIKHPYYSYRGLSGRMPEILVSSPSQEDLEDTDGLLPEAKDFVADKHATCNTCKIWLLFAACFATVLIAAMVLFSLFWGPPVHRRMIDDVCFEHTTYYSPVTKHIDTTPRLVITNGSLGYPSIWRGIPSEEIDKAWEDISYNMGVFSVPEDVAIKAGVKKGDVRIPAGYPGSGEYMVSLELTHQFHCVNFLRKAAWFNYPIYKAKGMEFRDPDEVLETHLYHCIETLRQVVMCNADTGLIGYRYVQGREHRPYPDFNTPHKCRDWKGMLDFAYAHTIQGHPEEHDFVPGPDEIVWDSAP